MHSTVFDKVTVTSETKVQLKNNPQIEIQLTLHKLSSLDPLLKMKNKKGGRGVGVPSYPIHIGGGQVALNLQISCLKLIVKSENTPWLDFHFQVPFVYLNFFESRVTSHAVHIGGVKVTNNVICKWKCHFGATYMDGMTGEPPFYF